MAFTAQDVKALREQTGAGMMDCKKALEATDGDMEKAAVYLREQGVAVAAKKASRIASEGVVAAATSADGKTGALVEINCESDFVAKGDQFVALCNDIAEQVIKTNPNDLEALLASKSVKDANDTVQDMINNATLVIGEKISLRRFTYSSVEGRVESYIHMGGKIGVLLTIKTGKDINSDADFAAACHDVAMHIAAFSPKYTYSTEVPADEVDAEKAILKTQMANDPKTAGKPDQIIEKMMEGKIKKFYKEVCLIDQDFVKDPSVTISGLFKKFADKHSTTVEIVGFERFMMGEGLEKKNENFAEEIAKMSGK